MVKRTSQNRCPPQHGHNGTTSTVAERPRSTPPGIGLAIVQKAVQRLGGRVGVHSTPGQGRRFWLELPAA